MEKYTEVKWHGRAGQGVVTASFTLAEVLVPEGKYVQAFPEFSAEKRGAPIMAFNRISDSPIRLHSNLEDADVVVVMDPSLLLYVDVKKNSNKNADFIINTTYNPDFIKDYLNLNKNRVYTLDANSIALKEIGIPIPNIPIMTLVIEVKKLMPLEKFKERVRESLFLKSKPELVEANLRTVEQALNKVKRN